jgi:hypothetical protein
MLEFYVYSNEINNINILDSTMKNNPLKAYKLSELIFFILKVVNIRCFILIAVEIFHNIMHRRLGTSCAPLLADLFLCSYEGDII